MENKVLKSILEWSICFIVAVILALLIRTKIIAPTMIKQVSMNPTLKEGQRVLLNRLDNKYSRGDIVTFEAPSTSNGLVGIYKAKTNNIFEELKHNIFEINKTSYIKRIIGIQGDRITIENGKVYLNKIELKENYLPEGTITSKGNCNDIIIPEGYVYVMGDNRNESMDSRTFGCIPIEKLEGKVWYRYWPISEFEKVN